jgi:hypothetical protein
VGVRSRSRKKGSCGLTGAARGSGSGQPDAFNWRQCQSARTCLARVMSGVWWLGACRDGDLPELSEHKAWMGKWYQRQRAEDGEEAFVEIQKKKRQMS